MKTYRVSELIINKVSICTDTYLEKRKGHDALLVHRDMQQKIDLEIRKEKCYGESMMETTFMNMQRGKRFSRLISKI